LKNRGFEDRDDGTLVRKDGNLTVTVDPCSGEVTVSSRAEATVDIEVAKAGFAIDDVGPDQARLEKRLRDEAREGIDEEARRKTERLTSEASAALERHLEELQPEIGRIVNKVTREALKAKAARMGNVKEIAEDERTGEMTIKVEV
jgi:hypothetical protein